jgi:hypothetical protein
MRAFSNFDKEIIQKILKLHEEGKVPCLLNFIEDYLLGKSWIKIDNKNIIELYFPQGTESESVVMFCAQIEYRMFAIVNIIDFLIAEKYVEPVQIFHNKRTAGSAIENEQSVMTLLTNPYLGERLSALINYKVLPYPSLVDFAKHNFKTHEQRTVEKQFYISLIVLIITGFFSTASLIINIIAQIKPADVKIRECTPLHILANTDSTKVKIITDTELVNSIKSITNQLDSLRIFLKTRNEVSTKVRTVKSITNSLNPKAIDNVK